jgi:hypothetical protein
MMEKIAELKAEYKRNETIANEIRNNPSWPWVDGMQAKIFKAAMDNMDRIKGEIAKAVLAM